MPEWLQIVILVFVSLFFLIQAFKSVYVLVKSFRKKKKVLKPNNSLSSLTDSLSEQVNKLLREVNNNESSNL